MWQKLKTKIQQAIGISFIDSIHKVLTFRDFFIAAFPYCLRQRVKRVRAKQAKKIESLKTKSQCRVLFFLQTPSVWKCDVLYHKLLASDLFDPIVIISPFNVHLNYDKNECFRVMRQTEEFAKRQGYKYVSAYNWDNHQWLDIKKLYKPDIVFFTKPYKDTLPQYHIYNFEDALTLYVPYAILNIKLYHNNYELPFHSLLWKFLLETEFQQREAIEYEKSHGDNVEVVGALGMEKLMQPNYQPKDVWKPQPTKKKRIIWAPHHTVDYLFNFSNFIVYCEDMLRLALKYKDQIQIAFKPHPVLKFKLINLWGEEKTNDYYQRWTKLENGQLEEGEYIDLFKTSDAMIHDCASFTAEYLYTKNPVLFQIRDEHVKEQFNDFGEICFSHHYHAYSIEDTERFIQDVVINGNDPKKSEREQLYHQYLLPKDGVMPSDKIISILRDTINK